MSEPGAAPGGGGRRSGVLVALGLAALLAGYALCLWAYFVPVLGSPDANCYHVSARLLNATGALHRHVDGALDYVGGLWLTTGDGDYYPKYPPFYPALAAAAERLFGPPAGLYVNPVAAWLAVLFGFVAARALLPGWAALIAAGMVASGPVFDSLAIDQIAHAPSVALLSASFALFLWAARGVEQRPEESAGPGERARPGPAGALAFGLAGLLLGLSAGVRYTNVLLVLPGLVWFGTRRLDRAQLRRLGAWGLGVALPWLALGWYHWRAFGSPLRTAYSLTDEQSAFSLAYLGRNLGLYLPALFTRSLGPLLVLSLAGLALVFARAPRRGLFFAAWTLPLVLLYLTYYYAPEHHPLSYVRFLQPLQLPAVLLACTALVAVARRIRGSRARLAAVVGLVLVQLAWAVPAALRELELRHSFDDMLARRVAFARQAMPPGSTILATRWLLDDLEYHLDPARPELRRLYVNDLIDQERLSRMIAGSLRRGSIQTERMERLAELLVDVPPEQHRRAVSALIERGLADGQAVFLVGAPGVLTAFEAGFAADYELEPVAVLPALEPRHVLVEIERAADLSANPAWGETTIARIRPR